MTAKEVAEWFLQFGDAPVMIKERLIVERNDIITDYIDNIRHIEKQDIKWATFDELEERVISKFDKGVVIGVLSID